MPKSMVALPKKTGSENGVSLGVYRDHKDESLATNLSSRQIA